VRPNPSVPPPLSPPHGESTGWTLPRPFLWSLPNSLPLNTLCFSVIPPALSALESAIQFKSTKSLRPLPLFDDIVGMFFPLGKNPLPKYPRLFPCRTSEGACSSDEALLPRRSLNPVIPTPRHNASVTMYPFRSPPIASKAMPCATLSISFFSGFLDENPRGFLPPLRLSTAP